VAVNVLPSRFQPVSKRVKNPYTYCLTLSRFR
jgi:hypothetical protein